MKVIERNEVAKLADTTGLDLVSLYLPFQHGADSQQNVTRVKNALRSIAGELREREVAASEVRERLAPLESLLHEWPAWDGPGEGLAAFLGGGVSVVRVLPFECDDQMVIGNYFHVRPLLQWLADSAPYYVLAVSQNSVRLFRGTRDGLRQLEISGLPTSLDAALGLDQPHKELQQHSAGPQLPGKESLVFHGQGGAPDTVKDDLLGYFREIDRALAAEIGANGDPMIFIGVDYLFPIYREANTYAHLLATNVVGNPELWSAAELHERAWPIIESQIRRRREAELDKFGDGIPLGRSSAKIEEILPAANLGAVATLFVDLAADVRGSFDPDANTVHTDGPGAGASEDLINVAVNLALRNRGAIEPCKSEQLPKGAALAALMRYPFRAIIENLGQPPVTEPVRSRR
jgi:hypothetical protein